MPARQTRLACAANSVRVSTTRSGAPSTAIEPIEPEKMPTSNPSSSAMRAEIASYTEPVWTQRSPARSARNRSRRSVQSMSPPFGYCGRPSAYHSPHDCHPRPRAATAWTLPVPSTTAASAQTIAAPVGRSDGERGDEAERVARQPDRIAKAQAMPLHRRGGQRRQDQRGEDQENPDQLHRDGDRHREQQVEQTAPPPQVEQTRRRAARRRRPAATGINWRGSTHRIWPTSRSFKCSAPCGLKPSRISSALAANDKDDADHRLLQGAHPPLAP